MSGKAKMKIKRDDRVIVIAGKDKGKSGVVKRVIPGESRVVVVGINMVTRHAAPSRGNPEGGRVRIEASIHVSNVALADPKDNKPARVGYRIADDKRKVRVSRRTGEVID